MRIKTHTEHLETCEWVVLLLNHLYHPIFNIFGPGLIPVNVKVGTVEERVAFEPHFQSKNEGTASLKGEKQSTGPNILDQSRVE